MPTARETPHPTLTPPRLPSTPPRLPCTPPRLPPAEGRACALSAPAVSEASDEEEQHVDLMYEEQRTVIKPDLEQACEEETQKSGAGSAAASASMMYT